MPRYFKPAPTARNYDITRKLRSGRLVRDQLPSEGIYTEHEMAQVLPPVPGDWIEVPRSRVAIIFGLRQLIGE